jgi:hypothetical protein
MRTSTAWSSKVVVDMTMPISERTSRSQPSWMSWEEGVCKFRRIQSAGESFGIPAT